MDPRHGTAFRPTWEDYQQLKTREQKDETPGSAIFLLADSSLLFWKEQGYPWIDRVKCELPTRELTVDGREPPVKASYVGCCNGDLPEFYDLFLGAMERIGITDCMHIHAKPNARERAHLEQSDVILLAGGDIKTGWPALEFTYIGEGIKWRLWSGACVIGIAEGATLLGAKAWYKFKEEDEDFYIFKPLNLVPLIISCNDPNEERLKEIIRKVGFGAVGLGIPKSGGVIFNTDGAFEPVKTIMTEIHYPWQKNDIVTSLVFPPAKGEGMLVAMDRLRRREEKYGPRATVPRDQLLAQEEAEPEEEEEAPEDHLDAGAKAEAERLRKSGNELFKAGDHKKALATYREALRCTTYDPDLYTNIAPCCLQLGKPADAVAACTRALELTKGSSAKAWYRRGLAHQKCGDLGHAHYDFREALVLSPGDTAIERQKDVTADDLRDGEKDQEFTYRTLIDAAGPLSTVVLDGQPLGPHGAKLLARCLRTNDTVMTLKLRNCYIRSYGAEMLGQVLLTNDRLTELDLGCNAIRSEGLVRLSEGVRRNTMLAFLDLSRNNIDDGGIATFAETLKENGALREVSLAHNRLTFTTISCVAAALKVNHGLEKLDLSSNRLGPDAIWRLLSATAGHANLNTIDLRGFRVSPETERSVAEKTRIRRCQLLLGPLPKDENPSPQWPLF